MTFRPHYLLAYGGDFISDPNEIWANNIRMAVDDNVDGATHQSLNSGAIASALADCVTKVKAHMAAAGSGYSSNSRLKYVKLNEIQANGRYANASDSNTAFMVAPFQTGSTNSVFPLTTAMVVTFLTSAERGPGSRGRVFVPQPHYTLGAAFRWTAATQTAVTAQWRTFLDGLEFGDAGSPIVPAVVSNVGTPGPARTINQVQLGDVPDYMGSRRNRLTEGRVTSATFN